MKPIILAKKMMMVKVLQFFMLMLLPFLGTAQITFTAGSTTYTQNFDDLPSTGGPVFFSITGWSVSKDTLRAGTGTGNTGSIYSYGASGSTDRALGSLTSSGYPLAIYGVKFANSTGGAIKEIKVDYNGEMWRMGDRSLIDAPGSRVRDTLYFEYSTNATSVTDAAATWIAVPALHFVSPDTSGAVGERDGNSSAFKANIKANIAVDIADGSSFWVRFRDERLALNTASPAIGGSHDGLAVDDLKIEVSSSPSTGIKKSVNGPQFTVYPNPARNGALQLLLDGTANGTAEAAIFSTSGQQISAERVTMGKVVSIDISRLSAGTYVVMLQQNGAYYSAKFVVAE